MTIKEIRQFLGLDWENLKYWLGIILILAWAGAIIWLWVGFFKMTDTNELIKRGVLIIVLSMTPAFHRNGGCKCR